jgi:hypothetical protein
MDNKLPDFILTDLFPNSLVLVESEISLPKGKIVEEKIVEPPISLPAEKDTKNSKQEKIPSKPSSEKWFLGNNDKKITILVNEPEVVFLEENSLQFLTKILGACKLNMGDIAVVNIAQFPTSFDLIKKDLLPNTCILFDVKAASIALPFTIPNYQIQKYGGCTFLMAPSIVSFDGESTEAKLAKTKLWVSLKTIFNL